MSGPLSTNTTYKPRVYIDNGAKVTAIAAAVGTAPSGGPCVVDLLDDGVSIFANETEMANVAAGQFQALSATKNAVVGGGSYLTVRTGSTVNGAADLTVTIFGYAYRASGL